MLTDGPVTWSPDVLETLARWATQALEAGGVLLGRYGDDGAMTVEEITAPLPDDLRAPTWWVRRDLGHMRAVVEAYGRGLHYLGDWHTHPRENDPVPSETDLAEWAALVDGAREQRGPTPLVFAIAGRGGALRTWYRP